MALWRIEYWYEDEDLKDYVDLDLPGTLEDQTIIEEWFDNNLDSRPLNTYGTKL